MNKILFFAFAILFFSCANNSNDTTGTQQANMPEEEKKLRAAIAKHPDSLLLTENLVQYFRNNDNYSQAIAETENALKKDSLSERLWYMKATLLFENEDTLKAITAWEKVLKINFHPEYAKTLGFLYAITRNNLALGMGDVLMTISKPDAFFIKGLYYSKTGDRENAIAFFNECLAIDYKNLMAYREKAIVEYDMGKYLEALKTLELAIAIKQTYDEAYYWAGRCYEKLGKKEEAIDNYRMALQISPDYAEAKDALGKMGAAQ